MSENKFTPRAEEALRLSQEAAEEMGHGYVGSEHLLLGLIREEEGIAHRVLAEYGVTDEMVCGVLQRSVGKGLSGAAPSQGLTPRAKSVVELAVSESARMGSSYIGTEHLLMGILREGGNMALRILRTMGVDPKKMYSSIVKKLNDTPHTVTSGCVIDETIAIEAVIENGVDCGPRAYLRPGTHMLDGSKAGTHVEIKKSTIGEGSKVPHLSYIGDTTMGSGVNVGAGSITCNYDGVHKHKTVIGKDAFIGSDTMMVAPAQIGDGALVAAGSVITEPVPADALGLGRARQVNIEGWAADYRRRLHEDDEV